MTLGEAQKIEKELGALPRRTDEQVLQLVAITAHKADHFDASVRMLERVWWSMFNPRVTHPSLGEIQELLDRAKEVKV
jgi:hypothetical protein